MAGDFPAIDSAEATSNRVAADICAVICTRDRVKHLRRALRSLVEQAVPPAEILVVDNAPRTDCTRVLVCEEFPSVRYVRELVLGLDFARNRALREAQSEIVAFLDDGWNPFRRRFWNTLGQGFAPAASTRSHSRPRRSASLRLTAA